MSRKESHKSRDPTPFIGTSIEYFPFRLLNISTGNLFTFIGEAVVGANVAKALNLKVGDDLISSPENLFDLAGTYPLKMPVVGIPEPSYSPDDEAVFVDIKTSWIIEGIGHGHKELSEKKGSSVILSKKNNTITGRCCINNH